MILEVGKYYKCRTGQIYGPLEEIEDSSCRYQFIDDITGWTWTREGLFGGTKMHNLDLIEEVEDPRSVGQILRANAAPVDEEFKAKAIATATEASKDLNPPSPAQYFSKNQRMVDEFNDKLIATALGSQVTLRVGDRVKAFGMLGTITDECFDNTVTVTFDEQGRVIEHFEKDGRLQDWHKEPSLALVSRPKRKVTKTLELYVNISQHGEISGTYEDDLVAKHERFINGIATAVKLTGTYEVEE